MPKHWSILSHLAGEMYIRNIIPKELSSLCVLSRHVVKVCSFTKSKRVSIKSAARSHARTVGLSLVACLFYKFLPLSPKCWCWGLVATSIEVSHYKDKTMVRPSYLFNGKTIPGKTVFYIETWPYCSPFPFRSWLKPICKQVANHLLDTDDTFHQLYRE